jgi:hypothetical protein
VTTVEAQELERGEYLAGKKQLSHHAGMKLEADQPSQATEAQKPVENELKAVT